MKAWVRRTIGILSLGGSAAGIVFTAGQLPSLQFDVLIIAIMALFAVTCAFGMYCGVLLLECDPRSFGLALPFWLLQVPLITSPILTYKFYTGLHFDVTVSADWVLGFYPGIGSQLSIYLRDIDPPTIGVNVVAVVVLRQLWKHRNSGFDE